MYVFATIFNKILRLPLGKNQRTSFYIDLSHQVSYGAVHAVITALAIIVLKQYFDGTNHQVAFVQSALMAGLLCSLLYTRLCFKIPLQHAFIGPRIVGCLILIAIGFLDSATWFARLTAAATFALSLSTPVLGRIYQQNYPKKIRGKIVAFIRQWQLLASVMVAWVTGRWLELEPGIFRYIFPFIGLLGIVTSLWYLNLPVDDEGKTERFSFRDAINIIHNDRNFALFMLWQFFLGFFNIAGMAVMLLYINNKEFLALGPELAALLIGGIPPAAMFLSVRWWGGLFDRISIVNFRFITSICMALGFLLYASYSSLIALFIGAAIWGIGRGGGQLAWSIGVLSFATQQKALLYLSIHTFLTGVRGTIAPFIAVWFIDQGIAPQDIFLYVSLGVVLSASLILISVRPSRLS